MLLTTSVWTVIVYVTPGVQEFVFNNLWLFYASAVATPLVMCMMMCCYRFFNKYPRNYLVLSFFTLIHSYLIGAVCAQYEPKVVVASAVCTCVMFVGLSVLACVLKQDIRLFLGTLVTFLLMIITLVVLQFILSSEIWHLAIVGLVVTLLSIYIIWDTQMIVGGKRQRYQLDLNDYVMGAMILYSDIITIFLYILEAFAKD